MFKLILPFDSTMKTLAIFLQKEIGAKKCGAKYNARTKIAR
jgi:hypothetical protein